VLANWREITKSGLPEQSYKKVLHLANKAPDWNGPGSLPLDAASLATFLDFWGTVRNIAAEPDLVLTPGGNLQAEWYSSSRRFLEIDFRGKGKRSFIGLFDGGTVIEGAAPVEELTQIVLNHRNGRALSWH
jgi:hypothetical protein